jgi:hypothetical protein
MVARKSTVASTTAKKGTHGGISIGIDLGTASDFLGTKRPLMNIYVAG